MKRNSHFLKFLLVSFLILSTASIFAKGGQGIAYYKAGFPQVAKPLLLSDLTADSASIAESCYYLGNIYFGENLADSAAYYYNKGLSVFPMNSLNTVGLAMLKMKTNLVEADQNIATALKLKGNKKNIELIIAIANAYLVNGLFEQATEYQEKAKQLKGKYAGVYVLLGDIMLAKKDIGNACSNYEQAILFDSQNKEAYIKYARAYKGVNPALSIEKLGVLKEKDPSFLLVDKELADIYYTMNKFDEAVKHYEIYMQSGNSDSQVKTKYAMTLFFKQDFAKSLEIAQLGLVKSPRNPAFNRLAMYNNVALKKYDEGLKYADLLFNKSDKAEISYFDYTYYGQALKETKQFDLAIAQYEKAFKLDSTKNDLNKEIANMSYEKKDTLKGIASYEKYLGALSAEKRNGDVLFPFGKILYGYAASRPASDLELKKSTLIKADTIFAQIALLEPIGYRANYWRARVNFAMDPENTQDLAKNFYEKTLALVEQKNLELVESKQQPKFNPIVIECSRFLGFYYYVKKDFTQSKVYWNKILLIEPNNDVAKKAISGIDNPKGKK